MSDSPSIELPADVTCLETGLTFDELQVGQRFLTGTRLVDQAAVQAFAEVSGDDNPVHLDPDFARRTFFRGVVAHGALTQAVATGLGWRTGIFKDTLIAIAENHANYKKPVRPGDELRVVFEVLEHEADPQPKWGHVRFGLTVLNQTDEVVALGTWYCLLRRSR
ncbi:MAG: MaoC/PaaZ C-terminal domain-containing protein [Planctomycetota bacterium]|nr:MaoC/PaaZ C-terminal domain-containing protein [Planctomycetota bacterium]